MHKKAKKPHETPRLVALEKRRPATATPPMFPLLEARAKEAPTSARTPAPSERARLRAATVAHAQREARTRHEVLAIVAAAERPAPTVLEELDAIRRRPWDAPMATRPRIEPQPPASRAFVPIPEKTDAIATLKTVSSFCVVTGCILLALWLGYRS